MASTYVKGFLVASSIPFTVAIFAYIIGMGKTSNLFQVLKQFPLEVILVYGVFGIINTEAIKFDINWSLLVGAILGIVLNFIAKKGSLTMFDYTPGNKYYTFISSAVFSALTMRFVSTVFVTQGLPEFLK